MITLGLVGPLLHWLGGVGAGVAWLAGQVTVAIAVLGWLATARRRALGATAARRRRWSATCRCAGCARRAPMHVLAAGEDRIIRLADSDVARRRLIAHRDALQHVRRLPELREWQRLIPQVTASGDGWLVETALPGVDGRRAGQAELLTAAAYAIAPLHRVGAAPAADGLLREWVEDRLALVADLPGADPGLLGERLADALAGRGLLRGWVHGDLWAGNLLLDRDHRTVTGLLGWEAAGPAGVPAADLAHLVVRSRAQATGRDLARTARRLVDGRDELTALEARVAGGAGAERLATATVAQLAWLQHLAVRRSRAHPQPGTRSARRAISPLAPGVA